MTAHFPQIERACAVIDPFNYTQLNRATNCPSWPGGVARSAGVVVQALDRMLTEPDSRKTAGLRSGQRNPRRRSNRDFLWVYRSTYLANFGSFSWKLNHHPGASRHPSWPGGAIRRTIQLWVIESHRPRLQGLSFSSLIFVYSSEPSTTDDLMQLFFARQCVMKMLNEVSTLMNQRKRQF
jgi:hypothetical protein